MRYGATAPPLVQPRVEALPGGEDLLLGRDAPGRSLSRKEVELGQRRLTGEVEAQEVDVPPRVARVALDVRVGRRHRAPRLHVVLRPVRVEDVDGLRDDAARAVDLAREDDVLAVPAQVLEGSPALGHEVGHLVEGAVAGLAGDLDRVLHLTVEHAVPHHVTLRVAIDAVHPALVVEVGRADRGIVEIEDAVQLLVGRAGDVRAARSIGRELGQPSEVQADRGVPVVTGRAGLRGRGPGHPVVPGMSRLPGGNGRIRAPREAVARVGDVTRRTPLSPIVAVEPHASADRPPLRPQVALHALLARKVRVVTRELVLGKSVAEGRDLVETV